MPKELNPLPRWFPVCGGDTEVIVCMEDGSYAVELGENEAEKALKEFFGV